MVKKAGMANPFLSLIELWLRRYRSFRRQEALPATGRPVVVVTGGSEGIGLALAARVAADGHDLLLIARNEERLAEAAGKLRVQFPVRVNVLTLDLTHAGAAGRIEAALAETGAYADVLINNAAIGLSGPFTEQSAGALDSLVVLNMAAPVALTRHFLPGMLARGRGGILNVASLGGMVPGPGQAAYYASKAFLISLTRAVGHETRGLGVRVAVVAPGPVRTDFHARMESEQAPYLYVLPVQSPEAVARAAWRGYKWGRRVIVTGSLNQLNALAMKVMPHAVLLPLMGFLLTSRTRDHDDARGPRG